MHGKSVALTRETTLVKSRYCGTVTTVSNIKWMAQSIRIPVCVSDTPVTRDGIHYCTVRYCMRLERRLYGTQ
jgi:hypothetical protein